MNLHNLICMFVLWSLGSLLYAFMTKMHSQAYISSEEFHSFLLIKYSFTKTWSLKHLPIKFSQDQVIRLHVWQDWSQQKHWDERRSIAKTLFLDGQTVQHTPLGESCFLQMPFSTMHISQIHCRRATAQCSMVNVVQKKLQKLIREIFNGLHTHFYRESVWFWSVGCCQTWCLSQYNM